jgi:hypothetical protein
LYVVRGGTASAETGFPVSSYNPKTKIRETGNWKRETLIGFFYGRLGLLPGSSVVRRAAAFHLPVYVLSQFDVFETAFASH